MMNKLLALFLTLLFATPALAQSANPKVFIGAQNLLGISGWTNGDTIYYNNGQLVRLPIGTNGQVLNVNGSGLPAWATGGGGSGTVTSISNSDSTITLSPNPITATGTVSLNLTNANTWTGLQTLKQSDAATNTVTNAVVLTHDTSGTPAASFGTGILLEGQDSTTADVSMANIQSIWTTATHASRTSALNFQLVNNAGALSNALTVQATSLVTLNGANFDPGANGTMSLGTSSDRIANLFLATGVVSWNLDTAITRFGAAQIRLSNASTGSASLLLAPSTGTIGTDALLTTGVNSTIDNLADVQLNAVAATQKPLVVQGFSSQSANLQEWQNNSGTALGTMSAAGVLGLNQTSGGTALANPALVITQLTSTNPTNIHFISTGAVNGDIGTDAADSAYGMGIWVGGSQQVHFATRGMALGTYCANNTVLTSGQIVTNGPISAGTKTGLGTVALLTINPNNTADNNAVAQINTTATGNNGLTLNMVASATGNALTATNSSGTAYVTLGPPTLTGSSTTSNFLNITGTLPSTLTAQTNGVNMQITAAGSSAQQINALSVNLAAGYTGSNITTGCYFLNSTAGVGATPYNGSSAGNFGAFGGAIATTTGTNVGLYGNGQNGNINYGVFGEADNAKNSATNVGGIFVAKNTGTTPTYTALYAGLLAGANPTFTNSVCTLNNVSVSAPILLCQVNGTTWHQVDANGNTIQGNGSALATTATNGFLYGESCAGTPTGVPANLPTGSIPEVTDTTNKIKYAYINGAWVALSGVSSFPNESALTVFAGPNAPNASAAAPTFTAIDTTATLGGASNIRPLPTSGTITGEYWNNGNWTQTGAITSNGARIHVTGTMTINNTWTVNTEGSGGQVSGSGSALNTGAGGSGAGLGSGGGGASSTIGPIGGGGGGHGGTGGEGGVLVANTAFSGNGGASYPIYWILAGSGGGGGSSALSSTLGGVGGAGGGSLYIEATGNISCTSACAMTATGAAGSVGGTSSGSGGGGSGGGIQIRTFGTFTLAASGSITATGGNGGAAPTTGAQGSGGGGGIIDISSSTTTNSGTITAGGGTGSTAGSSGIVTLNNFLQSSRSSN